jgi:hypothetical protein
MAFFNLQATALRCRVGNQLHKQANPPGKSLRGQELIIDFQSKRSGEPQGNLKFEFGDDWKPRRKLTWKSSQELIPVPYSTHAHPHRAVRGSLTLPLTALRAAGFYGRILCRARAISHFASAV